MTTSIDIPQYNEITNLNRVMGSYPAEETNGPVLICVAGLHGNEPSGVFAMQNVLRKLREKQIPINGKFMGLNGNLSALDQNLRFVHTDLNRLFTSHNIKALETKADLSVEEKEMQQILTVTEKLAETHEEVYYIDCHTTSSPTIPYNSVNEYQESIDLVQQYPLCNVIGLEKNITGCIAEYFSRMGFRGFTIESGQHHTIASVENCEAAIWLFLVYTGLISLEDLETFQGHYDLLKRRLTEEKKSFEVVEHYQIKNDERFIMEPGFVNFQKVSKGELLATNQDGTIRSNQDGRILMPLYQPQGDDGYFILKPYGNKAA